MEKRPDFLEVGRQAIAASLITFEDAQQRHRESGDWYRFLSNKLIDNVEDGKSAPFTILTFNYDRSLDFYLYTAFRHALRIDGAELGVKLSNLKIIHLHGSLCRLPWQVGEGPARDYGDTNGDALITSANNIKIIHEQNEGTEVFKQAHAALNRAARIVFLGFGFHATNVRRLLAGGWLDLKQRGMIYASSHGMIHAERQAVERTFSEKIILPEAHSDCLGILRNVPGFLS
ncbi:MAG: hypothetical protein JSS11_01280 [Verrucomicrobia bacterium]|nr:hypothetical protein [Verrucomicrobiota bacterium]